MNKNIKITLKPLMLGALASSIIVQGLAQGNSDSESEIFELSPFEVSGSSDNGYVASETIEGTRFNSQLKDVPSQISIMTKEFLDDIAAVTVDEAYLYSANIENTSEFVSAGDSDYANGILNTGGARIRGLSNPGNSRDFFRTELPRDNYNIDRITISSGPNAILFGNANPGGVVNTAFMRAKTDRPRYEVSLRLDSFGSMRGSVDLSQPIIKDKLALRLALVSSDQNFYKEPAYSKDDRFSAAITYKPFDGTTLRAYIEDAERDSLAARNTYVGDQLTPWLDARSPMFDNSVLPVSTGNSEIFARVTQNQDLLVLNSSGTESFINYRNNSVITRGPEDQYSSLDNYAYTIPYSYGESIYPYDLNVHGNGTRNAFWGDIYGASLEQKLPGGGYFEAAYNRESFEMRAADTLRGGDAKIYADANLYLPDAVTPNPDAGRLYIETTTPRVLARFSEFEEMRAQVSYEIDFTENDGWSKWLGRHRVAGMVQRSTFVANSQQEFQARLIPNNLTTEEAMDTFRSLPGNNDLVRVRYYLDELDDPNGSHTLTMPFDPLTTTTYDYGNDRTYWAGADNPFGGTSRPTIPHERIDSMVFASQSYFFDGRLVVSFGLRNDEARTAYYQVKNLTASSNSGYESLLNVPLSKDFGDPNSGDTTTLGSVFHALPWLSVFYNESSTWNPETQWSNPDDGSQIAGATGDGMDYGVMMRFLDNRVSLRINRYENTNGPAQNVTYRNAIVPDVQNIERYLIYAAEDGLIDPVPAPPYYNPEAASTYQETSLVSQLESTGFEFSLTANPTKNFRLSLNGAKADSVASDIGTSWINYVQDRSAIWAANADISSRTDPTDTVESRYLGIIQTLNQMAQADGQRVEQGREWRLNLVGRYSFDEGSLKGAFVGGGLRWRSKAVLGYALEEVENLFPFEGSPSLIGVPALDSPIWGESTTTPDFFVGYSRKLGDNINWRIQLNVRNILDDDDPVSQRANLEEGFITRYYVPEPRSFILTNTLTF